MKRRMEQLKNGRFEYEVPKLVLSEEKITVTIKAGEKYRGELLVACEDKRRIKGMIMSSNRRVLIGKEKFSGIDVSIPYGVDGTGLQAGDFVEASITINSNMGEYVIPVEVTVQEAQIHTSTGEIKNLDDFVKLAERDYREAFRLFTKDVFVEILKKEDRNYLGLYQGMSQNPVTYQHMEEFLIGTGKKEPVRILLEQEEKKYAFINDTLKDSLVLTKNNWGYVTLEIETKGEFLTVERKMITADDFIGSLYELEYYIDKEKVGTGKRYGQILIHSVYGTVSYQIVVSENDEYLISTHLFEKKMQIKIAKAYQNYRFGNIDIITWRAETIALVQQLNNAGCGYPRHRLVEAFARYQSGDITGAMSTLWPLRDTQFLANQMEEEGIYLVLALKTNVITETQRKNAAERIETLYRMLPNNFALLEAYIEMTEKGMPATKRLLLYEETFEKGCCNPFLYQAVLEILEKDPSQLKKLSPFMIQVMMYAAKHGKLTEELARHIGHLSEYVKQFQNNVYYLLVKSYEAFGGKDLLNCICKYIIKGQPRKKEYFRWYSQAVKQDMRITRLYEYYIETMPDAYQEVLPQVIRMYFVYNNTLSSKKRAMVYANVIRNKEIDKVTYHSYRKAMEQFALDSLKERKINEDYATIYQECLGRLTSAEVGEQLIEVMFTYRVFCDDPKIHRVIVCHEQLEQEQSYPCKDGVAYIQLYTSDAKIIFEDGRRRRYAVTVDYNLQKLMNEKEYIKQCVGLDVSHYGLLLAVCENKEGIHVKNLGSFQNATQMEVFKQSYRHKICRQILEYYAQNAGDDTLNHYLKKIDYMTVAKVNKALLVEILIDRALYDIAFEILKAYGYEGIQASKLVKLTSRLILRMEFISEEELVYLAMYVFEQGLYDEVILNYLKDNYWGSLEQMVTLWQRMKGFQMETYALEEEILLLAMFGRVYLKQGHEILKSYVQQGGKQQVILAYVSLGAYEYFLGNKETADYIFECLEICLEKKWEADRICRLALLKYYTEKEVLKEEQKKYVHRILKECNEAGLRFAFFRKLPEIFTNPYQLDDKQFVEERFPANAKVSIHYQIEKDDGMVTEKKVESVKNMYQGIFVKEFLLFYGETLKYYLTVENEKESYQTEEKTLKMEDTIQHGYSKYQLINQMLVGRKLNQDKKIEEAMEQYLQRECFMDKMFRLME